MAGRSSGEQKTLPKPALFIPDTSEIDEVCYYLKARIREFGSQLSTVEMKNISKKGFFPSLLYRALKTAGLAVTCFLIAVSSTLFAAEAGSIPKNERAMEVVEAAIDAMGGDAYRSFNVVQSRGRLFSFRRGRKGFARFNDWTVYNPVKSRFQLGEGKRQYVTIYNLELDQGWRLEGESTVEDVTEEDLAQFRKIVKKDLHYLLKQRLDEEGMSLFYFGPDEIAGAGRYEAVEFLDATNQSIVVFFDRRTHLPSKLETTSTDSAGIRHEEEVEFSNWHVIQGVKTYLRTDYFVDGEISQQSFVEELQFDPPVDDTLFQRPTVSK